MAIVIHEGKKVRKVSLPDYYPTPNPLIVAKRTSMLDITDEICEEDEEDTDQNIEGNIHQINTSIKPTRLAKS